MARGRIEGGSEDERKKWTRNIIRELKKIEGVADAGVNDFASNRQITSLYIELEAEEDHAYRRRNFKKSTREKKVTGYDIKPSLSAMTRKIKSVLEDNENVTTIRSVDNPDPIYNHIRARNPTESNKKESTGLHHRNLYIVDITLR